MESLRTRIQKTLRSSREPEPSRIAARLFKRLTMEEKNELALEALDDQVRHIISLERHRSVQRDRHMSGLKQEIDQQTRANRKIREDYQRKQLEIYEDWRQQSLANPIRRAQHDFADQLRALAKRVSLESLYGRVCVRGEWRPLGGCTASDLRELAEQYAERATNLAGRGAWYEALALELEASGCATLAEAAEKNGVEWERAA